jgi:hypothetical protein
MQKIVLTNEGFNLLNTNHSEGQSQYWIGYYGLAYVPEGSALSANMTTLTPDGGDNIYNVFQGSMTTAKAGIDTDISDPAAYNLANECMYSANVMSRFRYVLDDNDNNQLVIFADNRDLTLAGAKNLTAGLVEYAILRNTDEEHVTVVGENDTGDGITKVATLPLPAPLYYGGEPKNYSALDATLVDTVTHDTRSYSSSNHALAQGYDVGTPGIDGEAPTSADKFDYVASRGNTFSDDVTNVDDAILDKSWQLQSVSNFNRFHAPTNAEGYSQDYEPACRNMAKVTKLFPIDHYDVISTTESDTNKVATVKYTVKVDLRNSLNAISNRSTPYYRMQNGTLSEVSASNYKAGFKFNRVGIYAVQTSLHAYNTEEDAKEDCTKHHLQMQVIGDSEPVLVAVMDLSTPIVMSEDGICDYSFDFQINFVKPDSEVIDDAAIYYNLYEDDAITWYKNQLIANASTAEAVTSLGVQMAYLRQQINQYTGAGTSSCGIVDEDNRYALEGHTHPYMKNIVDSVLPGNGAVRGIDTLPEDSQVVVYKRNGRALIKDDTGVHYQGDDETDVPQIIEPVTAEVGDYSMLLGKKSAAIGDWSLNLSENGILGANTSHNLLMGGKTVNDELNDHVAIEDTKNSIIFVDDTTEIEHMKSCLWMGSADVDAATHRDTYVDHKVYNTIGIGRISIYHTDHYNANNPLYPTISPTPIQYNIMSGGIDLFGWAQYSLIFNDAEHGNSCAMGDVDLMYAFQPDAWVNQTNDVFDDHRLPNAGIAYAMLSGNKMRAGRNIQSVVSLGIENNLMYGVNNSILIGNRINKLAPQQVPFKMLTVDEFNEKYSSAYVADDDYDFDAANENRAVVVGYGTIEAKDANGNQFTYDVKGVSLYVSYGKNNEHPAWIYSGDSRLSAADAYNTTGHDISNMFILGDDNNVGAYSHNSIVIGDDSTSRFIEYDNCFIHNAGSPRAIGLTNTSRNQPRGTFNNVWWIGHQHVQAYEDGSHAGSPATDDMYHYYGGNFLADQWWPEKPVEFSDVFAFVGRNLRQFGYSSWYGASNYNNSNYTFDGWQNYTRDDLYQPCKAPMIYSGGIALGGYGTSDSNFMLMKIGVSGCTTGWSTNGNQNMWIPPLNNVRDIICIERGDDAHELSRTTVNTDGSFDLYDDLHRDGIHHLQVKSPYAGMVLMVQDKQELDGTLHVGLGKMSGGGFDTNGMRTVKVSTQYVTYCLRFCFEITTKDHSSLEYLDVIDPFQNSGTHVEGESVYNTISSPNEDYQISYRFIYHADSSNELYSLRITYLPNDTPVNLILNYREAFTGVNISKNNENGVTMYGMETAGKLAMVTFSYEWPFVTANNEVVVNYPMFDLRGTNNDKTVSMCVATQNYVIPRPDTVNDYNTTVMLVPLEIPGYYNRSGWSHDPYPGIMRANSDYQSTDSRANGQLPYFCRVQHVKNENRVI